MRRKPEPAQPQNWVVRAQGEMDRIEAYFTGAAFEPHRHDTLTIGLTMEGVQSFNYRGEERHSEPGNLVILHPDELHDGYAGTDSGFRYRSINIEPILIQSILGGKPLPFIEGGISTDKRLLDAVMPLLQQYDRQLDTLEEEDALYDIVQALSAATNVAAASRQCNYAAADTARSYIQAHLEQGINMAELEAISGHDRWELSRDFRALFGTSPYRYLTMCRLREARKMLRSGQSIADTAIDCSFADQSHFTRQFKKAYGMTPRRWTGILASH